MDPELNRARALLVTSAQSAGLWALGRVSHLLLVARTQLETRSGRLGAQVPPPVQRFGKNLWQRITTRFPALAHLLDELPHGAAPASTPPVTQRTTNGFAKHVEEESVASLVAGLRDPSAEIAAVAALRLGSRSEPEAGNALREVLKNAEGYFNPLTRVAALQAFTHSLAPTSSPDELEPLLELVRDVDAEVSMAAIDAVVQRAPSSVAIDRLLPVVLDDTGYFLPIVRAAATRALERAGLLTTGSA